MPYADGGIQAGFPSPAQDLITESIDLNREIVKHPAATFYGRVSGESMSGEGIDPAGDYHSPCRRFACYHAHAGSFVAVEGYADILVIDRSLEPANGDLAVCCLDGEFTLKRISLADGAEIWVGAFESQGFGFVGKGDHATVVVAQHHNGNIAQAWIEHDAIPPTARCASSTMRNDGGAHSSSPRWPTCGFRQSAVARYAKRCGDSDVAAHPHCTHGAS